MLREGSRFWALRWAITRTSRPCWVEKTEEHRVFLEYNPNVDDLQSAWFLLLFCASIRACLIRNVQPELVVEFAQRRDARIWDVRSLVSTRVPASSRQVASLPNSMGGQKRPMDLNGSTLGQLGRCSRHDPPLSHQLLQPSCVLWRLDPRSQLSLPWLVVLLHLRRLRFQSLIGSLSRKD